LKKKIAASRCGADANVASMTALAKHPTDRLDAAAACLLSNIGAARTQPYHWSKDTAKGRNRPHRPHRPDLHNNQRNLGVTSAISGR
jgi:hypothetical protein